MTFKVHLFAHRAYDAAMGLRDYISSYMTFAQAQHDANLSDACYQDRVRYLIGHTDSGSLIELWNSEGTTDSHDPLALED